MVYNFELKGLDCANCALELEREINKIEGIENATINFMTEKMKIECEESNKEEVFKKIKKIVKREEPDCTLKEI